MYRARPVLAGLVGVLALALLALPLLAQEAEPPEMPPEAAVGLAIGGMIVWLVMMVVGLAVAIWVAIWIYKDAESRGQSGVLWVVLWLFTGLIGLIIWLVIRGSHPQRA